ncbi:uncharacterized protein [Salminus brasiliensis]|uniref:uncharacterized protein n=1 Tax=Salminus brasiliensis TaxID=930266 RepID=UPI003B837840
MKMLTVGFTLLLYPIYLVRTQKGLERDGALTFVQEGHNVTITCHYQSDMAMHFSWYKHKLGQKPQLISTIYKYDVNPTFYNEFKNDARFEMVNGKGLTHLIIKKLLFSDSATYYCGSAHSNIVEFGEGTELIVRASQIHSISVLHQPTLQPLQPGDSVTLECTIFIGRCAGEHSVYWFRHVSGDFRPGIIYTQGDSNRQCAGSSATDSSTQSCVYKLPKRNLSLSDAGTYYCAVAACGEILFGNGSKLSIMSKKKGVDCSDNMHILVLLSIIRSAVLLCSAAVIILYCYTSQRVKKSYQSLHSRKSTKKIPSQAVEKNNC